MPIFKRKALENKVLRAVDTPQKKAETQAILHYSTYSLLDIDNTKRHITHSLIFHQNGKISFYNEVFLMQTLFCLGRKKGILPNYFNTDPSYRQSHIFAHSTCRIK